MIRGEPHDPLNPSLQLAADRGMRLTYLDRPTYRRKTEQDVLDRLHQRFGDFYLVPEGGSNALAVRGCAELVGEISDDFDVVCCGVGTGGTLAGIAAGLGSGRCAIGFSSLKGGGFLSDDVAALQRAALAEVTENWEIETGYHFGGYARSKPELTAFIDNFEARHGLRLDRVYVAKMLYGVYDLAARGRFRAGATIIAVVTGVDLEAQPRSRTSPRVVAATTVPPPSVPTSTRTAPTAQSPESSLDAAWTVQAAEKGSETPSTVSQAGMTRDPSTTSPMSTTTHAITWVAP